MLDLWASGRKGQEGEQDFYSLGHKDLLVKPNFKGRQNITPLQRVSSMITVSLRGKYVGRSIPPMRKQCEMA